MSDLTLQSCKKLTAEGLAEFCAHSPPALQKLNLSYTNLESKLLTVSCITHATSDVIFSGLPKMDGCSSLSDLTLQSCKKLTAEGLAEFCAHSPPALQKLNLSYTNLESKLLTVSCITHATSDVIFSGLPKMDGCSSLSDLMLSVCKKLTAEGLAEFCAHSPPALQKLDLSQTNLESKLLTVSCITHSTPNKIA